jgi:hypothetical protein
MNTQSREQYNNSIHTTGRIFTLTAVGLILLVPIFYCIAAGVTPSWSDLAHSIPFALGYIAIGLIEAVSYAPLLGTGGQYLSFITGNIANLKLPCAINAQSAAKTQQGTEEQELVTTVSIAVSSIVTTIIIMLGLIPLFILQEGIVEVLAPVSPYVIPAIFGGLTIALAAKFYKLAAVPFLVCIFICVIANIANLGATFNQSTMVIVGMAVAGVNGYLYYKRLMKKEAQG